MKKALIDTATITSIQVQLTRIGAAALELANHPHAYANARPTMEALQDILPGILDQLRPYTNDLEKAMAEPQDREAMKGTLSDLREARGWTLEKAAELFGCTPAELKKYEAGKGTIRRSTFHKMGNAFGLSSEELFHYFTGETRFSKDG